MKTLWPIVGVFGGFVSIAFVVIFELRESPKQESEMIKREDEAMSKLADDPHEFARWVP